MTPQNPPPAALKRRPGVWLGAVLGIVLIVVWYAATRTTMWNAYGSQNTGMRTLSQAQGICNSDIGQLSQTMSAQGAANCASINHSATLWNAAGFAGLVFLLIFAALITYRATRPATASGPSSGGHPHHA